MGYHWVYWLSLVPVLSTEVMEFLVLTCQLDGLEDDLLVSPLLLLNYSDFVGLGPGRSTRLRVVE